jgi:predicted phosphodiesterase
MTLAILADIHGNIEALDAVLRDIDQRAPKARIVCAGDVVGYGPDPEACLQRLLDRDATIVRGNHEEMVLDVRDDSRCVAAGILAVAWTKRKLSRAAKVALAQLPSYVNVTREIVVCHGDLDDAGTYVSDEARASHALDRLREMNPKARTLICGHTHTPMWFTRANNGMHLLNPGGVGQARDGKLLARYALLDEQPKFIAVPYDHRTTIAKLRDAGLVPRVHIDPPRGHRRHIERIKAHAARVFVRMPSLWRVS